MGSGWPKYSEVFYYLFFHHGHSLPAAVAAAERYNSVGAGGSEGGGRERGTGGDSKRSRGLGVEWREGEARKEEAA